MLARNTVLAFGLACLSGSSLLTLARNAPAPARTPLDAHRALGRPTAFRNLTLIPVYDARATAGNDYMTLDEGLKSGVVIVKESSDGGEVNTLYLTNRGKKALYLMAGEVVLGGQQDRCIGSDSLVSAGTKKLPITVFCVEHGRWTGQANFGMSARMVASSEIRASAQYGALNQQVALAAAPSEVAGRISGLAGVGAPSNQATQQRVQSVVVVATGARNARNVAGLEQSVGGAQEQVWAKVATKNRHFNTESESGTYRTLLNMSGGDARKSVAPYLKAFSAGLAADPHLVGVVAAVNGKVVAADIFGNTTLYAKLWPKLLRSYAADAAESAGKGATRRTVSAADAARFLQQAASGKDRIQATGVTGVNTRLVAGGAVTYRLTVVNPVKAIPDTTLHENVLRK